MAFIPFAANWASEVRETLEYQTTLFSSDDGSEQRRSLRQTPRRQISFEAILAGDARRDAVPFLSRYQRDENRIPDHVAEPAHLTETPLTTATAVTVDHQPHWLITGKFISLVHGMQVSEYQVTAISVSGIIATVTLANALGRVWPAGTKMLPSVAGFLTASVETGRRSADVTTLSINFSATPGVDTSMPQIENIPTFDPTFGHGVLLARPNWSGEGQETFVADSVDIDFSRGRMRRFTPNVDPGRSFVMDFVCRSRAEVGHMTSVFKQMRGRRGEFLLPTWSSDFTLSQDVAAGSNVLRSSRRRFGQAYAGDPVFTSLAIVKHDGTVITARMSTVTATSTETIVTLDHTFTGGLLRSEVAQICLAPLVRFASDELQITWKTDKIAVIRFTCRTLKFREPEGIAFDEGGIYLMQLYGWDFIRNVLVDPLHNTVNVVYPDITDHLYYEL